MLWQIQSMSTDLSLQAKYMKKYLIFLKFQNGSFFNFKSFDAFKFLNFKLKASQDFIP